MVKNTGAAWLLYLPAAASWVFRLKAQICPCPAQPSDSATNDLPVLTTSLAHWSDTRRVRYLPVFRCFEPLLTAVWR